MKLNSTRFAAIVLLGLFPAAGAAQEFSADVVYVAASKPGGSSPGKATLPQQSSKLFVSKDKIRLETRGFTGTILLVNGEDRTTVALFPVQKTYQSLASGPSQYFRAQDAENACPDWQKASDQKIACEKVGHEVVVGRQVVKYQNKNATDEAIAAVWIDLGLKFVVKWEGAGSGAELHNIAESPQAAELFAVPSSYNALQPQKAKSKGFAQRKH